MADNGAKELDQLYAEHIISGNRCLDIGANTGRMTWRMLKHLKGTGEVISWEPDPIVYKEGIGRYNFSNLKARCKAISTQDGYETFYQHSESGKSKLGLVSGYKNQIQVLTERLDTWWQKEGKPSIDIIKIDCANDDLQVIQSGIDMIKSTKPKLITVEINSSTKMKTTIDELLADLGYTIDKKFISKWDCCYKS